MARNSGDPIRLALSAAEGQIREGRRLLAKVPDSGLWLGKLDGLLKELRARLEGMPLQAALELTVEKKERADPEEIRWRVARTEADHLAAYHDFVRKSQGVHRNGMRSLPGPVLELIRKALLVYDHNLLGAHQRDEWVRESKVRAAGIGIYHSPFHTGIYPAGEQKPERYNGPYLEHDRPWRPQRDKADPVLKFSEIYFAVRDLWEQG